MAGRALMMKICWRNASDRHKWDIFIYLFVCFSEWWWIGEIRNIKETEWWRLVQCRLLPWWYLTIRLTFLQVSQQLLEVPKRINKTSLEISLKFILILTGFAFHLKNSVLNISPDRNFMCNGTHFSFLWIKPEADRKEIHQDDTQTLAESSSKVEQKSLSSCLLLTHLFLPLTVSPAWLTRDQYRQTSM